MALSGKDRERLEKTEEAADAAISNILAAMEQGEGALKERLRCLQDVNSKFPETQEFLRARGLEHVSELDEDGIKELEAHLREVLKKLTSE